MAHLALLALLRLVGEDGDLLSLTVLQDLTGYGSTLNIRCADLGAVLVAQCDNRELNCLVFIDCKLLNVNNVAVLNLVLLTACFNNCKRVFCLPFL